MRKPATFRGPKTAGTSCYSGTHDLEVVYEHFFKSRGPYHLDVDPSSEVVRWCRACGGVVVDVDENGATRPGEVSPMMFPAFVREGEDKR